jgi:ribosomal-protein-alanine N-acetyltransferase
VNHTASNKILKKIGLKFIEPFDYEGVTHNWYTLSKTDWVALKQTTENT